MHNNPNKLKYLSLFSGSVGMDFSESAIRIYL